MDLMIFLFKLNLKYFFLNFVLQSSGKSSVLENLVGRDFLPRGKVVFLKFLRGEMYILNFKSKFCS